MTDFWGMRHIVSRALIQYNSYSDLEPPTPKHSCPIICLITNNKLDYVVKKEIPMLQELERQNLIHLIHLPPLNFQQRHEELKQFNRLLNEKEMQIIHLACHAFADESPSQSYLLISD